MSAFKDAANAADPAVIAIPISTTAAARPATRGFRLHHRQSRSGRETGRARIGSSRRNRSRSSAIAPTLSYRFAGSFDRTFRLIVSRSFGSFGWSRAGETGSWVRTASSVSMVDDPWNGGRPVSIS